MKRMWTIVLIGCALLLWMGVPADAAPLTCVQAGGSSTSLTVDTQAKADLIAGNGINDDNCDVTVNISILPTITNFLLEAKSITVAGPTVGTNPANPTPVSTNVLIGPPQNPPGTVLPGSGVTLLAKDFITIDKGSVKATLKVHIE